MMLKVELATPAFNSLFPTLLAMPLPPHFSGVVGPGACRVEAIIGTP